MRKYHIEKMDGGKILVSEEEQKQSENVFLKAHVVGCVLAFWTIFISAAFMRIFRHKELGWVDIAK